MDTLFYNNASSISSSSHIQLIKKHLVHRLDTASFGEVLVWLLGLCYIISLFNKKPQPTIAGAPVVGRRWWEPNLLLQWRFVFNANEIIKAGYAKYKDRPFVVKRYDTDITLLPIKYLEELRLVPRYKLNSKIPQVTNFIPRWTWTAFMFKSELHYDVLRNKMNPELKKYVDMASMEMEYAWETDVPKPDDWTLVDIQHINAMLVARMSARIFMGPPACRDKTWLKISVDYTHDMFLAAFTLRTFPTWMHPVVAHFIPARWRMRKQIKFAKKIVAQHMKRHDELVAAGLDHEDTLLDWMMEHGTPEENEVNEMGIRQIFLTLAAIHTTSVHMSNFLFDLAAHPEWLPILREEIEQVTRDYGRIRERDDITSKQWLAKLEKMDSFLVESQRHNPIILLRPQRMTMIDLTLKDGTVIPAGTRVGWAGHMHANDPEFQKDLEDPGKFDPMRSYRKRHANNGEFLHKFKAGQVDTHSLAFGYGGQACPGRYFAISELKLVMSRMLMELDFALPPGTQRPRSMFADENCFIDPSAKIMMRKRPEQDI